MGSTAVMSSATGYVSWEEVNISSDKGRREVHYYLKRRDGSGSDLAVIGKERSFRNTSYNYVNKSKCFPTTSLLKLRSRRDVIDWLNSVISGIPDNLKSWLTSSESYAIKISRLRSFMAGYIMFSF